MVEQPKRAIGSRCGIKEAARVFGVSEDTLRYYEKIGLVSPPRVAHNGYRTYDAETFTTLSLIIELRRMGFEIERIRSFLGEHTLEASIELLNAGLRSVSGKIRELERLRDGLVNGLQRYAESIMRAQSEEIAIQQIPARPCMFVTAEEIYFADLPYLFERTSIEHGFNMSLYESSPCYKVDATRTNEDGLFLPDAILLYTGDASFGHHDYEIPAGTYASCVFTGSFLRSPEIYARMERELSQGSWQMTGEVYEFSLVSEFETDRLEEYVSRLDVQLAPRE